MSKTPNFSKAREYHAMVDAGSALFTQKGEPADGEFVWNALTGRDGVSLLADAVRLTMPVDVIPLLRVANGLPAAFAFETLANAIPDGYADEVELREACEAAWHIFDARRRQVGTLEMGFGWDLTSCWECAVDLKQMPAGDLAQIEVIARMAGQMHQAMSGTKKARVTDDPEEVRDVERGGEVARLLANEIAQVFDPDMTDHATIRVLSGDAQQYRMQGAGKVARGPLVIVRDESGSMHDDDSGRFAGIGRNSWAAAVMMALTRIAHADNREVRCVHFSSGTDVTMLSPGDAKACIDAMRHFFGGGTDIARGLWRGIEQVGNLEADGHKGADIVLITDGEDHDWGQQSRALDEMARQGIRLWTVSIEMDQVKQSPIRWRAEEYTRVAGSPKADQIAFLREAALAEPHGEPSKNQLPAHLN